jgi:pimeloyl-ACP methyl ester carboxylesterase
MTTRKLTIKDLQLNVSICGTGSPLLLLNGLGGLIRSFDLLREELADYTTIALDVPGVGKSQTPRWPLRLSRHADLIAELLEQLGFEQVDVFGVSWGGALAQEFALRHPGMVRRLILAATSAGPLVLVKPADIVDFFGKSTGGQIRNKKSGGSSIKTLLHFGAVNSMLSIKPRSYFHQLAALIGWTSLSRLFRLRQRTLILSGDRDTLVRLYNAQILHRVIRHSDLQILQGEGHFFVVTSARQTGYLVRQFLLQRHDDKPTLMHTTT